MNPLRITPVADSNRRSKRGEYKSCRSEIVALRAFSKAVFELGPEFRPKTWK